MMDIDEKPFGHIADGKKRAWLVAFAITGRTDSACKAAGISPSLIYTRGWRDDDSFVEAREDARVMAADGLENEARRRAVEGIRSYKFNKDGIPLRHPEECECGHTLRDHSRVALGGDSLASDDDDAPPRRSLASACKASLMEVDGETGEDVGLESCDCENFTGAAYFEHSYADTLLIFLTKGALPERYRELKEVRGVLANLDLNLLPNALVARVAAGEPIEAVLAAGASEHGITPGQLVRGALAPGSEDKVSEADEDHHDQDREQPE